MGPLDDDADLRYARVGHIDQGRFCDELVKIVDILLSGQRLPARWVGDAESLRTRFGRGLLWSKTQSYHLLLCDGHVVFRIWTNTKADWVWVDVNQRVADVLSSYVSLEPIKSGNLAKCFPCTRRFKATDTDVIILLATIVRDLYELGNL